MPRKIGDKVTIRKDLRVGDSWDNFRVIEDDVQYFGKEFTIISIVRFEGKIYYKLLEIKDYLWIDETFEGYKPSKFLCKK